MSAEQVLAALVLAVVMVVWIGLLIGPARRRAWLEPPRRWWRSLRVQRSARREAADVIERVRRRPPATREGNVIRPRSFQRRRDDDHTLH